MDQQVTYKRLIEVAQTGDVDAFYSLLGDDPVVLDNLDPPLRVAVLHGHTRVVLEIVRLKPSLAKKLNQDGFTPIHLASTNGNAKMVKKLMDVDHDLCLLKGRDGRTPLHCASAAGNVDVVDKLLFTCPEAIEELTVGDETALHLAVKNNQLEAFKALLKWLKRLRKMKLLKWKDEEGNTVLHIATLNNQIEVVKMVLSTSYPLDINTKNESGLTVWDILEQLPRDLNTSEIREILHRAQAIASSVSSLALSTLHQLLSYLIFIVFRNVEKLSDDFRNALLVVATLIATVTYQAGLSPPGGKACISFMFVNSEGFFTSMFMISILTMGLPFHVLVQFLLFSLMSSYTHFVTEIIMPAELLANSAIYVMYGIFALLLFMFDKMYEDYLEAP